MVEFASIVISLIALSVSGITMWLTLFHRGRLKMTKPAVVFFGYDHIPKTTAKIFLRTLLFSTSAQGIVIESMYVRITAGNHTETFSFWGYGETNKLVPGSGLYVDKAGLSANHHFVLSVDKPAYNFAEGDYKIDVYAKTVGKRMAQKLSTIEICLGAEHAASASKQDGVLFGLSPETQNYVGHINSRED